MKCMLRIQRMKDKDWDESKFRGEEHNTNWNDGKEPCDGADKIEMKPRRNVFIWSNNPKCWKGKLEMVINHTEHCETEATNDKKEASKEKEIDPELVDDRGVDVKERGVVIF
jgi:hypothetical protein